MRWIHATTPVVRGSYPPNHLSVPGEIVVGGVMSRRKQVVPNRLCVGPKRKTRMR